MLGGKKNVLLLSTYERIHDHLSDILYLYVAKEYILDSVMFQHAILGFTREVRRVSERAG